MTMLTIEREYVAENEDEFASFETDVYDLQYAKNEIDFLIEVVGRDSYVDNFGYKLNDGMLCATFTSDQGYVGLLNRLTSLASITEKIVNHEASEYIIVIDNL